MKVKQVEVVVIVIGEDGKSFTAITVTHGLGDSQSKIEHNKGHGVDNMKFCKHALLAAARDIDQGMDAMNNGTPGVEVRVVPKYLN